MDIANMTIEEIAEHLTKDELAMANQQIKVMMGLRKSKHPKSASKAKQLKKRKQAKTNRKNGRIK